MSISSHKYNRVQSMLTTAGVFAGTQTRLAIWQHVDAMDLRKLTARQISDILIATNKAYHQGKHDAGAEVVDDAVFVRGKLIPLAAIDALVIDKSIEKEPANPNHWNPLFRGEDQYNITKYCLDYVERV